MRVLTTIVDDGDNITCHLRIEGEIAVRLPAEVPKAGNKARLASYKDFIRRIKEEFESAKQRNPTARADESSVLARYRTNIRPSRFEPIRPLQGLESPHIIEDEAVTMSAMDLSPGALNYYNPIDRLSQSAASAPILNWNEFHRATQEVIMGAGITGTGMVRITEETVEGNPIPVEQVHQTENESSDSNHHPLDLDF